MGVGDEQIVLGCVRDSESFQVVSDVVEQSKLLTEMWRER